MALDKTGTLTVGKPEVTDVAPAEGVAAGDLLAVAAAVERRSQHPLAEAVVRHAEREGVALSEAGDLQSVTVRGVRSSIDGEVVAIGSLRLWEQDGDVVPAAIRDIVERLQANGKRVIVVRRGEQWPRGLGRCRPTASWRAAGPLPASRAGDQADRDADR